MPFRLHRQVEATRASLCGQGEHGFEDAAVADLQQTLKKLVRKTQPFAKRISNSGIWVEPDEGGRCPAKPNRRD
ncbi:hypothetical protein [Bradyrhizobium liaoningense]